MPVSRIRRVDTKKQMDSLVDDFVTQGYSIVSQGENTTLVKKKSGNRVLYHVLLLVFCWWTFGIANLIYFLVSGKTDEVMVKVEKE